MATAPRIVLFDLGGVVCDWEPLRLYRQRFDDEAEAQAFCETVCTMAWHAEHDRGAPMEENAARLIEVYPHYEDHIRAWRGQWLEMFHGYVEGTPELMARLEARRTPLYGLSNLPAEVARETFDAFRAILMLRDVVVSGEEGVIKPDRRIYEIALSRMGSPDPEQVFFIDDRAENIEAARAVGMQGHVFETAAGLETALCEAGLV